MFAIEVSIATGSAATVAVAWQFLFATMDMPVDLADVPVATSVVESPLAAASAASDAAFLQYDSDRSGTLVAHRGKERV